jgi:hypothetical protein
LTWHNKNPLPPLHSALVRRLKRTLLTVLRTFTLLSTTPLLRSLIVKEMRFHGQLLAARASRAQRKSTPFAAQVAAEVAGKVAIECGIKNLEVQIKGPGPGRESAVRALNSLGIKITEIQRRNSSSTQRLPSS